LFPIVEHMFLHSQWKNVAGVCGRSHSETCSHENGNLKYLKNLAS